MDNLRKELFIDPVRDIEIIKMFDFEALRIGLEMKLIEAEVSIFEPRHYGGLLKKEFNEALDKELNLVNRYAAIMKPDKYEISVKKIGEARTIFD